MDAYLDISLLPDPEFPPTTLMNALFAKLHRALAATQTLNIGVSFPQYGKGKTLGQSVRLHGTQSDLQALMASQWLKGMADHSQLTDIAAVPQDAGSLLVRRRQCKSNVERLRRRHVKRKSVSMEAAIEAIPESAEEKLKLPYVQMKSASTGQHYRLFIAQEASNDPPQEGDFNAYGLSATARLPQF